MYFIWNKYTAEHFLLTEDSGTWVKRTNVTIRPPLGTYWQFYHIRIPASTYSLCDFIRRNMHFNAYIRAWGGKPGHWTPSWLKLNHTFKQCTVKVTNKNTFISGKQIFWSVSLIWTECRSFLTLVPRWRFSGMSLLK